MIPILYESTETSFTSNGIGRLSDAVSCVVTEERNGPYELEMEYPVTGKYYSDLELFRIIFAVPADGASGQPFEIYEISKPLDGVVTVRAWHISYRLNRITVQPFTAASCQTALTGLKTNSINTNDFTFDTDKNVSGTFTVSTPEPVRGLLGGQQGSILDVYGTGEYYWNLFNVYLYTNRGSDKGVTIRYGKNLTDLTATSGMESVYTGIVPYWYNEEAKKLVELSTTKANKALWSDHRSDYPVDLLRPVDLSDKWDEAPTVAQLRTAAQTYLDNNEGWELTENLVVSFVALADTEEYKDVAALQHVNLCDTVTIIHEGLGVSAAAKVIRTEYDSLLERYNEIELGSTPVSLGQAISEAVKKEVPTTSQMEQAIANGTALITGNDGGYIKIKYNADGQPQELLIMNNTTEATSSKIWRWNASGIGYSSDYGVTYKQAWTMDGGFYTGWVTAGTIDAALVNAGTIASADGTVQIVLNDGNGNTGQLIINSANFDLDANGNVTITGEINAQSGKIGNFTIDYNSIYTGTKGSGIPDGGTAPASGAITLSSSNFVRNINGTDRTCRFAIGPNFGVHPNGSLFANNVYIAGQIQANTGKIGGSNGLVVAAGKMYYGKSSLTSGNSGLYIGTDGFALGSHGTSGKKKPLLWYDDSAADETINVVRLSFKQTTNTSPYYKAAHDIIVDDNKRLYTGGGWTIGFGGTSGSNDWDGEYNTRINNTTFAAVYDGSDRRIKKNIRELTEQECLDFVMACNPVEFEYSVNGYPDGVHHGLIAQDVQKNAGKWSVVGGRESQALSLHYVEMIADLIKVAQNQERRIGELEALLKEKQ